MALHEQWSEWYLQSKQERFKLLRVLSNWISARKGRAFRRWSEWCWWYKLSKQKRLRLSRVLSNWLHSRKSPAFRRWVVAAKKRRSMRYCGQKVVMRMKYRVLCISFESWQLVAQWAVQEQERQSFTERHFKAFAQKESETYHLRQKVALQKAREAVSRMEKNSRAASFYSWSSLASAESWHRYMLTKVLRKWMCKALSTALATWVANSSAARRNKRLVQRIAARWYFLKCSKCMRKWEEFCERNFRLRIVLRRMRNCACASAFDSWLAHVQRDTVLLHRSRLEVFLGRLLIWGSKDAFSTWKDSVDRNLSRTLFVNGVMQQASEEKDECNRHRLKSLGDRLIRKWLNHTLVRLLAPLFYILSVWSYPGVSS